MATFQIPNYKVQVRVADSDGPRPWMDATLPTRMASCKVMKHFLEGGDSDLTCRILYTGVEKR